MSTSDNRNDFFQQKYAVVSTLIPDSPTEREARLAKHADAKRQREEASKGAMQEARAAAIDASTAKQFTMEDLASHDG